MTDAAPHTYHSANEAPVHEHSAPLDGATEGTLELRGGTAQLRIRAAPGSAELFRSRFTGLQPEIHAAGGRVTVRARFGFDELFRSLFGRPAAPPGSTIRLEDWLRSMFRGDEHQGELLLTDAVPWSVSLRGGAKDLEVDLRGLQLKSLDIAGGAADLAVDLPRPTGLVPVRLRGGAASIAFRRPRGVAARVEVLGGMASFRFDQQQLGSVGGRTRLQSANFQDEKDRYELDITGGASDLVVEEVP